MNKNASERAQTHVFQEFQDTVKMHLRLSQVKENMKHAEEKE
jgi:hypothetical protein